MNKNKKMLSPKIDVVFKMLFGEQKHERITKKLIEDVIEEKVETIELEQTPYLWGNQADDKLGIIDVRATINGKNPIDIEMQILDNHDIEKRILFYWSKLYLKQIDRGDDYNKLNRSISIIFLDYEIEKLKELPIHTKWQIRNDKNGKTILTEDLEIHIIEIPKI
ncbi:MAG: Rpn family recombination-promoting nuclease/putative transposase, partial [Clostridia bacterium]